MSEFQKGLLLGIMIMSSMFLFTASTKLEVERNENREIVEYMMIHMNNKDHNNNAKIVSSYIKVGWQPFGSLMYDNGYTQYVQPMVKYK